MSPEKLTKSIIIPKPILTVLLYGKLAALAIMIVVLMRKIIIVRTDVTIDNIVYTHEIKDWRKLIK